MDKLILGFTLTLNQEAGSFEYPRGLLIAELSYDGLTFSGYIRIPTLMGCDLERTKDEDPKNRDSAALQVRYINMNVKPLQRLKAFLNA